MAGVACTDPDVDLLVMKAPMLRIGDKFELPLDGETLPICPVMYAVIMLQQARQKSTSKQVSLDSTKVARI